MDGNVNNRCTWANASCVGFSKRISTTAQPVGANWNTGCAICGHCVNVAV